MRVDDAPVPTIDHHRPSVEPWPVLLHIGIDRQATANYVYDDHTAIYDDPFAQYTYDDRTIWPYDRMELFCRFHGLRIESGAPNGEGTFSAANVEMTLDNRDGALSQYDSAGRLIDWAPGSELDVWTERPGYWTEAVAYQPGYLTPSVGTATTTDPGPLPAECCIVWKVRPSSIATGDQSFGGQWEGAGNRAWVVFMQSGGAYFGFTLNGSTVVNQFVASVTTALPNGADNYFAVRVQNDVGATARVTMLRSADGVNYTQIGSPATPAEWVTLFDATGPLRVGSRTNATFGPFLGRLYSMEARTGLDPAAGTVLWRFDADDYPGTGTSWTDPRGRTWTVASAAAMTPKVPGVPSVYVPGSASWLFSGRVTAWRERADGTVEVEAFDAFADLNDKTTGPWDPGVYGDLPGERMAAILSEYGYTDPTRLDAGTVTLHSYQTTASPLEEMQAVARSDGGFVMVDADGTLCYRARDWITGRDDQTDVPTFSDNHCADPGYIPYPVWDANVTTDDDVLVNRVRLENVANVVATVNDSTSIAKHGPRSLPLPRYNDQWVTSAEGEALAAYLIGRRAGHYLRVESFALYVHDDRFDLWPVAVDRRIGDLVQWVHEQPAVDGVALVVLVVAVQSIVHEITPATWVTTLATTRTLANVVPVRYDAAPFGYDNPDPRNVYAY